NSRPTTLKTRFVADGQQLLRADLEINHAISEDMEEQTLQRVKGALDACSIIVLSDYAKGVLTNRVVAEIIKMAAAKKRKVLIDPKGRDFARYRGATMLTPNRRELSDATGINIRSVEDAEKAARQLIDGHQIESVLAKLGSDGICLVRK